MLRNALVRPNASTAIVLGMLALCLLTPGCVRRRMTIRSNPAGASIYVDKQLIGTSPASTSFTYYGTREIEVVGDGFRTEKILRDFSPPWYQIPPFDFFSETLWPWELRDERVIDITLVPSQQIPSEELQARANETRLQAFQGVGTPLPPTLGGTGFGGPGSQVSPLDPTFQSAAPAIVTTPTMPPSMAPPPSPPWQPGQFFRELVAPGGEPPTRIPETGILQGGGYRPGLGLELAE
ncbi:PEGA domain-containing protein [Aureliella helgolandensis]|uniref:PEGA domain protein n=1 Tax=Aureliella helgolandensis TaxID=2527968 RepID=A0A518GGH9_9BACT|nr:PEGA domain-containing protein [Aureliella helgolandensis]QDV27705.1 PEGA domain protein [Aureliella helgolandensis]